MKKGCGCLILSAVIAVVGVAVGLFVLTGSFMSMAGSLEQMSFSADQSEQEVNLEKQGDYFVFYGSLEPTDTGTQLVSLPEGTTLSLKHKDTGNDISLEKPQGTTSFQDTNNSLESLYTFKIEQPGTYVFTCQTETPVELSVGQLNIAGMFAGMGIIVLACLVALIAFIVGVIKLAGKGKQEPQPYEPGL